MSENFYQHCVRHTWVSQETRTSVFCRLDALCFRSGVLLRHLCVIKCSRSRNRPCAGRNDSIYRLLIGKQTERICTPPRESGRAQEAARFGFEIARRRRGGLKPQPGVRSPMEFSEHIKTANVEDVVLRQPLHPPSRGTLCITGHHLLFSDREEGGCRQVLLLLRNIDAIEKR